MGDVQRAREEHANVMHLAIVRAGDRLDALRPAPAGLHGHAGDARPAHANDLDLRLVGRPRLVWRRKVTHLQPGHQILLVLWTGPAAILNPRSPADTSLCQPKPCFRRLSR